MTENLKMREKLILEANNLLGEIMDDKGISDENLGKVISLKFDFENEILGNVKVYAPFMQFPDPLRKSDVWELKKVNTE